LGKPIGAIPTAADLRLPPPDPRSWRGRSVAVPRGRPRRPSPCRFGPGGRRCGSVPSDKIR